MADALVLHTSNRGSIPLSCTNLRAVRSEERTELYESSDSGSTPLRPTRFVATSVPGCRNHPGHSIAESKSWRMQR